MAADGDGNRYRDRDVFHSVDSFGGFGDGRDMDNGSLDQFNQVSGGEWSEGK